MKFGDLTPEQQEIVNACKTPEDMLAAAKDEGYELSDEELDKIAGGSFWNRCPEYGSHVGPVVFDHYDEATKMYIYRCQYCDTNIVSAYKLDY